MVTITITICLLFTPFIIAFLHSSIIFNKHSASLYANYFIVFNISLATFINAYNYLLYGDDISKFQGWIFTPAVFQIGMFQLSICLFSIISLFKGNQFKASCLILFSIFTILSSFSLFSGTDTSKPVGSLFSINIASALIAYILYKILSKKSKAP